MYRTSLDTVDLNTLKPSIANPTSVTSSTDAAHLGKTIPHIQAELTLRTSPMIAAERESGCSGEYL